MALDVQYGHQSQIHLRQKRLRHSLLLFQRVRNLENQRQSKAASVREAMNSMLVPGSRTWQGGRRYKHILPLASPDHSRLLKKVCSKHSIYPGDQDSIWHLPESPFAQQPTVSLSRVTNSPHWTARLWYACSHHRVSLACPKRICSACAVQWEGVVAYVIL